MPPKSRGGMPSPAIHHPPPDASRKRPGPAVTFPVMAKAREIEGLSSEEPYASAAAKVVAVRARELVDHSARVLDVDDIERVHDMRVATRRLRAALEVFAPCFPAKEHAAALKDV